MNQNRNALSAAYLADEYALLAELLLHLSDSTEHNAQVARIAGRLTNAARQAAMSMHPEAWPTLYGLASMEGRLLLALAEALPRIPDLASSRDMLHDKLSQGTWGNTQRRGFFGVAAGCLLKASRFLAHKGAAPYGGKLLLKGTLLALRRAARVYVYAETIAEALSYWRTRPDTCISFDMLGEAAITHTQAEAFYQAYESAIDAIAHEIATRSVSPSNISISVKLSALTPRFELTQHRHVMDEVLPRLHCLALKAQAAGIALTIDAEEAERLTLTLDLFERIAAQNDLAGWDGLGLAVQAYQKRASPLLSYLANLAKRLGKRIPVRLVKGAYWDTEIKLAQMNGLHNFPVFTHKCATDVSFLTCAKQMLAAGDCFYPQFATHNAHTVAYLLSLENPETSFEFQRLHGMGQALYDEVWRNYHVPCRVYAPIGPIEALLPYLVRRLLENGANSSFVNQLTDTRQSIDSLISDPITAAHAVLSTRQSPVHLPRALFTPERENSAGCSFSDTITWTPLWNNIQTHILTPHWTAAYLIAGQWGQGATQPIKDPAAPDNQVGTVVQADAIAADRALTVTHESAEAWAATPVTERSACLERAANVLAQRRALFTALLIREAGKCIPDALAECREAEDLLRYYAAEATRLCHRPMTLPGPVGERNTLSLHARGTFLCISPWNFPLAIYLGQIVAALAMGNTVIAKPAEQTPLVAAAAMEVLIAAGIPPTAVALLPGSGPELGARLIADERIAGVCFTGSTATAKKIQQGLSARPGPIVPFIAETGGINALIADSTAHPEQLVRDVLTSAFNSAGQRCSALRLLVIQEEIAAHVYALLADAIATLRVGPPRDLTSDVGPLIDGRALGRIQSHIAKLDRDGHCIARATLPSELSNGFYVAPCAYIIPSLDWLSEEIFGPILHAVSFPRTGLDLVIDALNAKKYGLTLGIHSRIDATVRHISQRARVGNVYVNRNMIGAVVSSQPFGGENLSGTGPKAGGPHYLLRFCTERCLTVNTAAIGGDMDLLGRMS